MFSSRLASAAPITSFSRAAAATPPAWPSALSLAPRSRSSADLSEITREIARESAREIARETGRFPERFRALVRLRLAACRLGALRAHLRAIAHQRLRVRRR